MVRAAAWVGWSATVTWQYAATAMLFSRPGGRTHRFWAAAAAYFSPWYAPALVMTVLARPTEAPVWMVVIYGVYMAGMWVVLRRVVAKLADDERESTCIH